MTPEVAAIARKPGLMPAYLAVELFLAQGMAHGAMCDGIRHVLQSMFAAGVTVDTLELQWCLPVFVYLDVEDAVHMDTEDDIDLEASLEMYATEPNVGMPAFFRGWQAMDDEADCVMVDRLMQWAALGMVEGAAPLARPARFGVVFKKWLERYRIDCWDIGQDSAQVEERIGAWLQDLIPVAKNKAAFLELMAAGGLVPVPAVAGSGLGAPPPAGDLAAHAATLMFYGRAVGALQPHVLRCFEVLRGCHVREMTSMDPDTLTDVFKKTMAVAPETFEDVCRGRIGSEYIRDLARKALSGNIDFGFMVEVKAGSGLPVVEAVKDPAAYTLRGIVFCQYMPTELYIDLICVTATRDAPWTTGKCMLSFMQLVAEANQVALTLSALKSAVPVYFQCGFFACPHGASWNVHDDVDGRELHMAWLPPVP